MPAKPTTPDPEPTSEPAVDAETEAAPQNRAARRAKAKQSQPSHVGPRDGRPGQGQGFTGRSYSKRP